MEVLLLCWMLFAIFPNVVIYPTNTYPITIPCVRLGGDIPMLPKLDN